MSVPGPKQPPRLHGDGCICGDYERHECPVRKIRPVPKKDQLQQPHCKVCATREQLRIIELETALREAVEDIESWGGYASEYFQDKHDLAGCLAQYRAVLNRRPVSATATPGEGL